MPHPYDSGQYEIIKLSELFIDPNYQRDMEEQRVKKIVNQFDHRLFGILEVSERQGGYKAVFDGQHRLEAGVLLGLGAVPCLVHRGLTPEEEAYLFTRLQTQRRGLGQIDRFRAQVFAGDAEQVALKKILDSEGFIVGRNTNSTSTISAIVTLERMYRRYGPDHVREMLVQLKEIWGADDGALTGAFMDGFSRWLWAYGDDRFTDEVKERLRNVSPQVMRRKASAIGGGGAQIGLLVFGEIQRVAKTKGRPRQITSSIWSDRKGEKF